MRTPLDFLCPRHANGNLLFTKVSPPKKKPKKRGGPHASKPSKWDDIDSALLTRRKLSNAERKRSMVTCTAPSQNLVNTEYCGVSFEKTLNQTSTHNPFMETKEHKEQDAAYNGNDFQKE